jgi:hypothetical protein
MPFHLAETQQCFLHQTDGFMRLGIVPRKEFALQPLRGRDFTQELPTRHIWNRCCYRCYLHNRPISLYNCIMISHKDSTRFRPGIGHKAAGVHADGSWWFAI